MKKHKKILQIVKKRNIYEFILKNPGLHKRELSRILNLPMTTLNHHLRYLEKNNLISSKYIGGYVRFWALDKIGQKDKEMLFLLRQKTPRNIILSLAIHIFRSQKELSEDVDKDPATIYFHLKKLKDLNIIEEAPVEGGMIKRIIPGYYMNRKPLGKEKIYRFKSKDIINRIYNLMIAHYNKLPDDPVIKIFLYIGYWRFDRKHPGLFSSQKLIKKPNDIYNSFEKSVWDVFPHPYHI